MSRALVIACGNSLRSDDGVGWRVVEELQGDSERSGIEVETVQQLTPELAEGISQAEMVIFVDAAEVKCAGSVALMPVQESPGLAARFTHSLTPATLLSLTRQLYGKVPAKAYLVGVGVSSFEMSEGLSESARKGTQEAVAVIRSITQISHFRKKAPAVGR